MVAHGAILRIHEKKPLLADQVAVNYRKADITPRQRAPLYAHGFDDEDIWGIAGITAFLGLRNRMANVTSMTPNPEFYVLGRVPRVNNGLHPPQ